MRASVRKVRIDPRKVQRQLHGAGGTGGCGAYRDHLLELAEELARESSPVNDERNARHRGSVVGTYRASWRRSSSRPALSVSAGELRNIADHAVFVELGRAASGKRQTFSWTRWGGRIKTVGAGTGSSGTRARAGRHVAVKAVAAALRSPLPVFRARMNSPYRPRPGFLP